jgi:hypothetical protein
MSRRKLAAPLIVGALVMGQAAPAVAAPVKAPVRQFVSSCGGARISSIGVKLPTATMILEAPNVANWTIPAPNQGSYTHYGLAGAPGFWGVSGNGALTGEYKCL